GIVCMRLGWLGGLRLSREPTGFVARERQGSPAFLEMVARLPQTLALEDNAPEMVCLAPCLPCWLEALDPAAPFAVRYEASTLGARAALIVPLGLDEGGAGSLLLLFSPVGFRGEGLI